MEGLKDDTTCIVIDILPPEKITPTAPPTKKQGMRVLKHMFRRKSPELSSNSDRNFVEPDVVEEIFEGESALLSQRSKVLAKFYMHCQYKSFVNNSSFTVATYQILQDKKLNLDLIK